MTMKAAEFRQMQEKSMREKAFGLQVEAIAARLGLRYYHTHNSKHSAPGWPDYVIASPKGKGMLFRELKRQGEVPTVRQQQWLDILAANGRDIGVWRPEDLGSGRILEEMRAIV
jgi:hypothetical protein